MKHLVTAIILAISASALSASDLEETFRTPPDKAHITLNGKMLGLVQILTENE